MKGVGWEFRFEGKVIFGVREGRSHVLCVVHSDK